MDISSISRTRFVLHSIYGDSFVFFNLRNFDFPSTVSISKAKSKLLIVSTLFCSIKSNARISAKLEVVIPTLVVDVIPTSANFSIQLCVIIYLQVYKIFISNTTFYTVG